MKKKIKLNQKEEGLDIIILEEITIIKVILAVVIEKVTEIIEKVEDSMKEDSEVKEKTIIKKNKIIINFLN